VKSVCPACAARTARLIDDQCPVCHGHGTITLHPAALSVYDPPTVSYAVTIACEAAARAIDTCMSLSDDQAAALAERIAELEQAGIIRATTPTPAAPNNVRQIRRQCTGQTRLAEVADPTTVAAQYSTDPPALFDLTVATAAAYTYTESDRPMMRGLPVTSANGHPSSLARITDPVDQLAGTPDTVRQRTKQHRQAVTLLEAVPQTIRNKQRKKKTA